MEHILATCALILVAVAAGVGLVAATQPPPSEPVADMNHAVHIERDLECVDCHVGVESTSAAGIPSVKICVECHEDEEDGMVRSENGRYILDHILRGEELYWPSLYHLPDDIAFSHRLHVAVAEIDCKTCHGDMTKATTLPKEPVYETLTMDGCMDCHEQSGASLDCAACHK